MEGEETKTEARYGAYRVEATLGSGVGGIATIARGVHESTGRVVALKALRAQIPAGSSFAEQLEREGFVLRDLAHPNIVMLLDAGRSTSGRPFLALEYVDGPTLEAVLAKKKRLPVDAALAIGCALASALAHAHERGVVHRDVKPSNVLLSTSGVAKLIDFGIAQRERTASISDSVGAEGITPSGRRAPEPVKDAFGTPSYMSPEQMLGDYVDGRSDLFSLGVVLYQMVSGARPFEGSAASDGRKSLAPRGRRDAAVPLRERVPNVSRPLERIVMRMLEASPSDRYASAAVVEERLLGQLRVYSAANRAALVKAALIDAGFVPRERRRTLDSVVEGRLARGGRFGAGLGQLGVGQAALILGAIGLSFMVLAFLIERRSPLAPGPHQAGERPLVLAPENAGGLRVVATPWAHVKIDNQLVETTPFARAIPLPAGRHFVTLTHPDYGSVDREVDIGAGEIVVLELSMGAIGDDAGIDDAGIDGGSEGP